MCTALTLVSKDDYHFFGRTMDLEYNFTRSPVLVPRNFHYTNIINQELCHTKYAILGMANVIANHPLFAEAFNENGLACAALNFSDFAYYEKETIKDKYNLAPYDLILWLLSNFKTVSDVKKALPNIDLISKPFKDFLPLPTLHWIVYDTTDACIVIEKTKYKFNVYDNPVGVLTNNPPFDWHLLNLNNYINLTSEQPNNANWQKQNISPLGLGAGLFGFPGDPCTVSRFIRATYLRSHSIFLDTKTSTLTQFFHILNNVSVVAGSVYSVENRPDLTLYTSCACLEDGIYYYNTYNNTQLNAISMFNENLDASNLKIYNYINTQVINFQN